MISRSNKLIRKESLKTNSLSQKVFYVISAIIKDATIGTLKLGEVYVNLLGGKELYDFCHRFNGIYYPQVGRGKKIKKEWEIQKIIKYLAQRKYIKLDKEQQKIYLAKKGIVEFIKFKTIQKQKKWDSEWRMIIFDVSENRRSNRDFLRTRLKWIGFKELQKSVWIFPYDVKEEIKELMAVLKYDNQGDIRFLNVEKIEDDSDLKKWFDLK